VARGFFRRHWQRALRIRERLRFSEEAFHLMLAGGVGIIGGLVHLGLHIGFEFVQILALGQSADLVDLAALLHRWQRLLTPAMGGLVAGAVLYWGLRVVGPQGSSHLLEVVVAGNGRLPFRTAIIKSISSIISIGTGGSIGREGAIVQLTATLASKWGQLANWQPYRLRLLVACGAASGIAAAYNAPVAGAVFAAQIVLGNFSMNLFAPLVFSSVIATMVSRSFSDTFLVSGSVIRFYPGHTVAVVCAPRDSVRVIGGGISEDAAIQRGSVQSFTDSRLCAFGTGWSYCGGHFGGLPGGLG
jgi:CIC family chloride channel protein